MKHTLFVFFALFITPLFVFASTVERVSVTDAGVEGNGASSSNVSVSSDGRFVAFTSVATNLIAGDTNAKKDVFVYDRDTDTIERVSVTDAGVEGNGDSTAPAMSADGRYVAFSSAATNLVAGDTNAVGDIFVYDRDTNTIERVSVSDAGVQGDFDATAPSISDDGRFVSFYSRATNLVAGVGAQRNVFVYDRDTNTIECVSVTDAGVEGNNWSRDPSLSSDGRYVAFVSQATNLVVGDTTINYDMFVYDRDSNTIERISLSDAGVEGNAFHIAPSISDDGRYVAFYSDSTNLVAGDTNAVNDIFLYDRDSNTVERVSVSDAGVQGDASSFYGKLSADGRYIAFLSVATTLVAGDTNGKYDIFVYDRTLNTIQRVSVSDAGVQGNDADNFDPPAISSDGRYAVFNSNFTNLVAGDTNAVTDTFIVDRAPILTVTTTVTNDNGGTLDVADFPLTLSGLSIESDVATTTTPGTYTVSQTDDSGYTASDWGGDCAADGTITMEFGGTYTCTITNDDIAPTLTVTTTVINNDRGSADIGDFPLTLNGVAITSGIATTSTPGAYTLVHGIPPGYTYETTWGGDCADDGTLTMVSGGTYTCTLTEDDTSSNAGGSGGEGGGTPHITPPPLVPPLPTTPLSPADRDKLIHEIKVHLISLIQQLITILRAQLAGLTM